MIKFILIKSNTTDFNQWIQIESLMRRRILPTLVGRRRHSSNTLTCFGCDMDKNDGNILNKNIEKTIHELRRCKMVMKKLNANKFRVISTHAMRKAKNKERIMKKIKEEVGFIVDNITQEAEAEYFFNSVIRDFEGQGDCAVIDVGGGSVQILVGNKNNIKIIHNMNTGAQFLHDNYTKGSKYKSSLTTKEDIEKMRKVITGELSPLKEWKNLPLIYGSSTIIDLMKAINIPLEKLGESKNHPYKTYAIHLKNFVYKILSLTYEEREKLYTFQKGYMWGVDKAFLNVIEVSEFFGSPYIIPTNSNVSLGIILSIV